MTKRNLLKRAAVAACIAASGLFAMAAPTAPAAPVTVAAAARTIRAVSLAAGDAASPKSALWHKAPVTEIALQPAFPGHASIVGTPATQRMTAQAVRLGGRLYLRLTWRDATANTTIADTDQFVDAAAVQFPVDGKADTLAFMGDPTHPVNIWQWRADGRVQNVVAKGFGTATAVPSAGLRAAGERTADGWSIVLVRSLHAKQDEGANLRGRRSIPVAFAVWDGGNQERDGFKAVTLEWWELRF
jgi:dimethylsulfide dehydrogenase subunit gamma/complex iron-sulfur molybdoenzyme family reductase subunit gamma